MTHEKIRFATKEDMTKIHEWLKQQVEKDEFVETLLCNWDATQKIFEESGIYVYISPDNQEPVAYLWPDFGILEVKTSHRRSDVGREIVTFGMQKLKKSGSIAIDIETTNTNSAAFWQKMGFKNYDTLRNTRAYKILDTEFTLPAGTPAAVEIRFYSEMFADKGYPPETTINPEVVNDGNGRIHLSKRVAISDSSDIWSGDPIIEIFIDGTPIFKDKCKRDKAKNLGVHHSDGAFYMDYINIT